MISPRLAYVSVIVVFTIMPQLVRCFTVIDGTRSKPSIRCNMIRTPTEESPIIRRHNRSTSANNINHTNRRKIVRDIISATITTTILSPPNYLTYPVSAADEDNSLSSLLSQIKQARTQLSTAPELIKSEQWDSIRALLIKPPLIDCWNKRQPLLQKYAEAVGDAPGGDELAVLEAKEELAGHLRYLDMAVYNNVFNPIKTEGETGATKELIRSYYEDPMNEYRASLAALDALIELGGGMK